MSTSGSTSTAALPRCCFRNARYVPFGVSSRSSAATSTPCFLAKPAAAGVGWPAASNAAETGGPVSSSSKSVCRSASLPIRAVSRRGVLKVSIGAAGGRRSSFSRAVKRVTDLRGQTRQPARGNLFDADFDQ